MEYKMGSYFKACALLTFGFFYSFFASAKESAQTPLVYGHLPKINIPNYAHGHTGVSLRQCNGGPGSPISTCTDPSIFSPKDIRAGTSFGLQYLYRDDDGDPEQGTTFLWSNGKTERIITFDLSDVGLEIYGQVTPRSAPPSIPSIGVPVSSPKYIVQMPLTGEDLGYYIPVRGDVIFTTALKECAKIGKRLLTFVELARLYETLDTVRKRFRYGSVKDFVADVWQWPSDGKHNGGDDFYWSSTSGSAGHLKYAINFKTGAIDDFNTGSRYKQVVCK